MNFLFLINAIFSFAIFFMLAVGFFRFRKNKFLSEIISYLSSIGILYLLIALSSLFWFFKFLSFSPNDFLILYSLIIFLQSLLLLKVIILISKNKKLKYFLFFLLISPLFFFYSRELFFYILSLISFLLCFLFFMDLTFQSKLYNLAGYLGMFYSFLGIVLHVLAIFFSDKLFSFSILLEPFFFILTYFLLRDLSINPPSRENILFANEKPYFLKVLSHLVFIIVIANLIFIGTIAVHEFGHFSVAKLCGCEAGKIVYEKGYFHTEVLCSDGSKNIYVLLGGILFPFLIAIILFFVGGKFMRDLSFLVAGFNFLSISRDLSDMGVSDNFVFISILGGISLLLAGLIFFAKSRVEEDIYLFSQN